MPFGAKESFHALCEQKLARNTLCRIDNLLQNKDIVDSHDIDVLDAFLLELVVALNVSRDLTGTGSSERARNPDLPSFASA